MGNDPKTRTKRTRIHRVHGGRKRERMDHVTVEEPLEMRIEVSDLGVQREIPVSVTMRTPGDDFALVAGFLFTEGLVSDPGLLADVRYCRKVDPQEYNVVNAALRPGVPFEIAGLNRNFYVTSSCGVCGKASLEAVEAMGCTPVADLGFRIKYDRLEDILDGMRSKQKVFERTGGIHAAGLFDADGVVDLVMEDVGRHNAVDKVIGTRLLAGAVPISDRGLVVSGRTSFDILQKAAVAGIPMVIAVGAPSSLAVDLARRFNVSLLGFARDEGFNLYAGAERVIGFPGEL